MAWWNNKVKALAPWPLAKQITKADAERSDLPLGWYIYQDGYIWYALRPNPSGTFMERSFHRNSPKELEEWLGIPVPEIRSEQSEGASSLDALLNQAASSLSAASLDTSPEDIPEDADILDVEAPEEDTPDTAPSKPRRGLGRNNQIMTRFSDAELARFRRRVQHSGLNQSEFLRRAALNGKIEIEERDPARVAILDELEFIRAELGRQGGMLKMVIKPNEGQRMLAPEEWAELIQAIRYLENTKTLLKHMEDRL